MVEHHDEPLVIEVQIVNCIMKGVLMDTINFFDVIFEEADKQLKLPKKMLDK